jgi:anti-anti-sigma regulatory factor
VSQAQILCRETFRVTCKIHRQAIEEDHVVLRVSGRITGDHVKTLRALLEQESTALTLDLKEVRLVDGEAVKLLALHESKGVRIDNCPLYIREWIRREREAT